MAEQLSVMAEQWSLAHLRGSMSSAIILSTGPVMFFWRPELVEEVEKVLPASILDERVMGGRDTALSLGLGLGLDLFFPLINWRLGTS